MEKSGMTECVFFEDEPSVPYINSVDYLKNLYTVGFEVLRRSGILTAPLPSKKPRARI